MNSVISMVERRQAQIDTVKRQTLIVEVETWLSLYKEALCNLEREDKVLRGQLVRLRKALRKRIDYTAADKREVERALITRICEVKAAGWVVARETLAAWEATQWSSRTIVDIVNQ